jgi:hypothetical protein
MKKLFFTLVLTAIYSVLWSQNNTVTARLDSNIILVGDQVNLTFSFSSKEAVPVLFPVYCDTCIQGIEIVKRSPIDTIADENGYKLSQQFTITAFDSGEYVIPPIPFYNMDSVLLAETEALLLNVHTIAVDTTLAIRDIKEPLSAPITIREMIPYILAALLVFGLIVGGIFLIPYLKNRKKPKILTRQKPKIPAHIIALQDLKVLWQKKLYQSGYVKQYYSELTDIVRIYIENRWDIAAMEMVTSEIVEALSSIDIPAEAIRKLEQTLFLSDMVKFAKSNPLPDESSAGYQHIVDFVEVTKQEKEPTENNQ